MERTVAKYDRGYPQTMVLEQFEQMHRQEERKQEIIPETKREYPILAWLVCLEGAYKGREYPIYKGMTRIGGSGETDIRLDAGGGTRVILLYNYKVNLFYMRQESGIDLLYINDYAIMDPNPPQLSPYDIVSIERIRYIFVPYCEADRQWG